MFDMITHFSHILLLLLVLVICGASYSYFGDNPLIINHRHRRRSIETHSDPRSLNFRFIHEPSNSIISSDGSALLDCNYSLIYSPSFNDVDTLFTSKESDEETRGNLAHMEWRKDGSPIHPLGRIKFLQNGSLWIEQATPVDEGQYQCAVHVVVRAGQYEKKTRWVFLSRRASLSFPYLHRFEQQPTDQHARIGQMAAFRCLLSSQPSAQIEWYHDNQLLKDGQDGYLVLPISKTLEISHVLPIHAGVYKCVARNGEWSRTSQLGTLTVLDGKESPQSMNWVLEPRNQLVTVGDSVLLECLANNGGHRQTTKIQWLHDSEQLSLSEMANENDDTVAVPPKPSSSFSSLFALVGRCRSHLLIKNVTAQMSGQYTCRAANSWRTQDTRATIAVRVPPLIKTRPVDVLTQETNDVEFECVAEGVPTPRITWSKNGEVIIPSEYFVIASNKLRIFGLVRDDQGVYQCMADNEVGSAQAPAQLLIDQADILSSYYTLLNRSTHQPIPDHGLDPSLLFMDSPHPPHHHHEILENKNLTSASPLPLISPSNDSSVNELVPQIPAAQPLSMHPTAVEAKNEQHGRNAPPLEDEAPEQEEEEEMEESQIVGAPSELRVTATHDSVQVSWLPPRDNIVLIRGYLIGWGINIPDLEKATVEPEVRHFTIRGLKPNREYVISLRAFNKIGHGFPIYETIKTSSYAVHSLSSEPKSTFGGFVAGRANDLAAPVGVGAETISSSQIRLSWTNPNPNAFNQIYTIKYGISNSDEAQHTQLNSTETEHTFDGLRPDSQYEFAVRLAQSDQWSLSAVTRTLSAPPSSPPRDLTVVDPQLSRQQQGNGDSTMVTLAWQPPKYANGEIQEYIVLYSDRLTLPDREWAMDSVKGDKLSIVVHNLQPGRTYHFKLQARNGKGYGPFSPMTSFTTSVNIPTHYTNIGNDSHSDTTLGILMRQFFSGLRFNLAFVLIGVIVAVVVVLFCIALFAVCFQRSKNGATATTAAASASNRSQQKHKKESKQRKNHQKNAYVPGRKMSVSTPSAVAELDDDLWLVHQQRTATNAGGRFAALVNTNVDDYEPTAVENGAAGILLIDGQQRAFIAPSTTAGLDFQSTAMERSTPKHYQHAYHATAQCHGGTGDGKKGISSGAYVPFGENSSSPLLPRGMMESFHSMTAADDLPKSVVKNRKQNRNSLPPHICPFNSATMSPFIINKHQQQRHHCHPDNYAQTDQLSLKGGGQKAFGPNFGRRSDSPVSIRSPCHQRVASIRMQCNGRIRNSSLNALDLSISSRLGQEFHPANRQPNFCENSASIHSVNASPLINKINTSEDERENNDNNNNKEEEATWQPFQVGIGIPTMALQIKQAKRKATANYEPTMTAARRHAQPTKSVNFASKLVIVSSDDDDEFNKGSNLRQRRWNGKGDKCADGFSLVANSKKKVKIENGNASNGHHLLAKMEKTDANVHLQKQQSQHSDEKLSGSDSEQRDVPRAPAIDVAMDSIGTLPRGHPNRYHLHNSSASLEMNSTPQPVHIHQHQQQQHFGGTPLTPRNPHVVYTRVDRQPIAKMDFSVNGSSVPTVVSGQASSSPSHDSPHNQQRHQFGAFSTAVAAGNSGGCGAGTPPFPPPPTLATTTAANRNSTSATATNAQQPYRNDGDGYQTVGGRANVGGGTMRSFVDGMPMIKGDGENVGLCGATMQMELGDQQQHANNKYQQSQQQQRMANIVRPIGYAGTVGGIVGGASPSPSTLRSAIGQPQAQKTTTPTSAHKFVYNTNSNGVKVPVGRATAQPRVNLATASATDVPVASMNLLTSYGCSSSSQYASVRVNASNAVKSVTKNSTIEHGTDGIREIDYTEEKSLREIDQMMETLHNLNKGFTKEDNISSP